MKFTKELWEFMKEKPIWWVAPIIIIVGSVIIFIILTEQPTGFIDEMI